MEQCFRTAFWMFFLLGYLQANPVPGQCKDRQGASLRFNKDDLPFKYLSEEVSCGNNVTFISPANMEVHCHATLKCFIEGLKNARTECRRVDRIEQIMEVFLNVDLDYQPTNRSECGKWENEGSRKQFADFVKDLDKFVEEVNSYP